MKNICKCQSLSESTLFELINDGKTFTQIQNQTGCCLSCGECELSIKFASQETEFYPSLFSYEFLSDNIICLSLNYPFSENKWSTGQSVRLKLDINGDIVVRNYTIANSSEDDCVKVYIKKNPKGVFTSYLFSNISSLSSIGISLPIGDSIEEGEFSSIIYLVAGIGVTPALSFLSNYNKKFSGVPAKVHCSVYDADVQFIQSILPDINTFAGDVEYEIKNTTKDGELKLDDIKALVSSKESHQYFICGPTGFMKSVKEHLLSLGVPSKKIKQEFFSNPSLSNQIESSNLNYKSSLYFSLLILLLGLFFILLLPESRSLVPTGKHLPGHEGLECVECHMQSDGTFRQQIQAKVKNLLGKTDFNIDFGTKSVNNKVCESCHEKSKDNHPTYRFLENRFKTQRELFAPHQCVSCHRDHKSTRVSLESISFCSSCHGDLKLKNDKLDGVLSPTHKELIESDNWGSCMGCHDYHGNNGHNVPLDIKEKILPEKINRYFKGYLNPYSEAKRGE